MKIYDQPGNKEFLVSFSHHLESRQRVVSECAGEEDLVDGPQVEDLDVVVEDDGLLLDEGQRRHLEQHLRHVVGVAPDLERKTKIKLKVEKGLSWRFIIVVL